MHMKIPWIFLRFPQFKGKKLLFPSIRNDFFSYYQPPLIISQVRKKICRAHSCGSQNLGMLTTACHGGTHPCWLQGKIAFPLPLAAAAPMSLLLPSCLPHWGSPPGLSCGDLPPPGRAQSARTGWYAKSCGIRGQCQDVLTAEDTVTGWAGAVIRQWELPPASCNQ